jgi:hypothetical protein
MKCDKCILPCQGYARHGHCPWGTAWAEVKRLHRWYLFAAYFISLTIGHMGYL